MRVSLASLIIALIAFLYGTHAGAQGNTANTFASNFSIGSKGAHIIALQKILNSDIDTRVAGVGPGSSGNETDYFGSLTKAAVVRLQEKYADEILAPVGLMRGNGYVGAYTRIKLNTLSTLKISSANVIAPSVPSIATSTSIYPQVLSASTTVSQNPNLKNLDKFLIALEDVAKKQGSSVTDISAIKKEVIKVTATTTDLQATFEEMVRKQSNRSAKYDSSFFGRILTIADHALDAIFLPTHVRAATEISFGGELLSAFPCYCSGQWMIYISPLPPSFVTILTYVPGSQAYLSYNIPATSWLLGEYEPGAGVCLIPGTPCWYVPNEGLISPMTGSSPL